MEEEFNENDRWICTDFVHRPFTDETEYVMQIKCKDNNEGILFDGFYPIVVPEEELEMYFKISNE